VGRPFAKAASVPRGVLHQYQSQQSIAPSLDRHGRRRDAGRGVSSTGTAPAVEEETMKEKPEWVFLSDMKAARQARRRLFELAEEKPEVVLAYLDGLPEGVEHGDEILSRLRRTARRAWRARNAR
jgi:hypothetical protein